MTFTYIVLDCDIFWVQNTKGMCRYDLLMKNRDRSACLSDPEQFLKRNIESEWSSRKT